MSIEEQVIWLDSIGDLLQRDIDKQAISSIKRTLRDIKKHLHIDKTDYNVLVAMSTEEWKQYVKSRKF